MKDKIMERIPESMEFVSYDRRGLIVRMKEKLPIAETGTALLNLEKRLHDEVNHKIEVFLEVLPDTNILRRKS